VMEQARYYSKHPDLYRMYETDAAELFCKCFEARCMNAGALRQHAAEIAAIYPSDKLIEDMRQAGLNPVIRLANPRIVYFTRAK
jgi:hypothetical protein